MSVAERVEQKLRTAFNPSHVVLVDESYQHAGHVGAAPQGETHFNLEITSEIFAGLNRVQRQRLVYKALEEELAGPIHALSIQARAPGEG
jgi:BolA protein